MNIKRATGGALVSLVTVLSSITAFGYDAPDTLPEDYKFYGRVNISLQRDHDFDRKPNPANNEIIQQNKWHSNASRVGVKGKYSFTDDLSFVYKGEVEVDANNGYNKQNTFFERREMYAGLASKTYGMVIGGKIDTPLRMLQSKVDLFSDLTAGDLKYLIQGKTRDDWTFLYMTPKWSGFTFSAATINFKEVPNDQEPVHNTGSSFSLTYEAKDLLTAKDGFYAGIARNINVRDYDIDRLALQYKWGAFTVGALGQNAERTAPGKTFSTGDQREPGFAFNAAWDFTEKNTVKVQWGRSQEVEYDGSQKAIALEHKFNKQWKTYVFHTHIEGDYYQTAAAAKQKDRTLMSNGIGIEYNF